MSFNRTIVPSAGGQPGKLFAEFLRIDEDEEMTLTELQSYLYDRMYRLGMVRHLDGTRAKRRRARERENAKNRRRTRKVGKEKTKTRKSKTRKTNRRRARV